MWGWRRTKISETLLYLFSKSIESKLYFFLCMSSFAEILTNVGQWHVLSRHLDSPGIRRSGLDPKRRFVLLGVLPTFRVAYSVASSAIPRP